MLGLASDLESLDHEIRSKKRKFRHLDIMSYELRAFREPPVTASGPFSIIMALDHHYVIAPEENVSPQVFSINLKCITLV